MEIPFTKMHGLGNDFVLVDCRKHALSGFFHMASLASKLCNRRFGIGADQLLLLCPSESADFRMEIYNADGSQVEMCGNGIRCLAKYIWDKGLSTEDMLQIETLAGTIRPGRAGELVRVDMGEPVLEPEKIPVNIKDSNESSVTSNELKTKDKDLSLSPDPLLVTRDSLLVTDEVTRYSSPVIDHPLQIRDREFRVTCVSMGNPHAVIFLDEDLSDFPVAVYGPEIENHPAFPKRTNVEFVNVKSRSELVMRVWERGSGETMACGTGASATGVAAMEKGLVDRKVTVNLLGGQLIIEWMENNRVYMTGPAVEVFEGKIELVADRDERRRHPRSSNTTSLRYYKEGEPETTPHTSTSIDISESGMGIVTEQELEPGQIIIFKNKENPEIRKIAIVQWSMKSGGKYRAGLLFI